jgi:3-oxoacyl-[acyl-carrier-protein] synthase-1
MHEVFVHSTYLVTSLGFGIRENMDKLYHEQSGSTLIHDQKYSPEAFFGSKIEHLRFATEFENQFPSLSIEYTLFEKLLLFVIQKSIQNISFPLNTKDTLLIISSTKGNIDLLAKSERDKWEKERIFLWKSAEYIQKFFKLENKVAIISNACISGVEAISVGTRFIRSGKFKNVIVAGADILSEFVVSGFQSFQSLSLEQCKPFDSGRSGLNLGEAAAVLILSSSENKSFAKVLGSASSNDANHISGPSRSGDGLFLAIQSALMESEITANQLDFISAHGTATDYNDEMESKALSLANLESVPVNSLKGYWGHTLGAAGLVESIVSIEAMKENKLIRTLGYENHGVSKNISVVASTKTHRIDTFLKTASGFGGTNAAIIFQKHNQHD